MPRFQRAATWILTTALALGMGVQGVAAQTGVSSPESEAGSGTLGLLPWTGCWVPEEDAGNETALCFRPLEAGRAEILHLEGTQVLAREMLWADGERHETVRDECSGWEEGSLSDDGLRVYVRAEHRCEDGSVRRTTALLTFSAPNEWLQIRTMELGGETGVWVQRMVPAPSSLEARVGLERSAQSDFAIRMARTAAAAPPNVADVLEAAVYLPEEGLKAWIAERGAPFALNGETLLRLADAGLDPDVIDVMVAVTYPRRFALNTSGGAEAVKRGARPPVGAGYGGRLGWRGGYVPLGWDPFFDGYYGWGLRTFLYSPFSYGYFPYTWGGYSYGYRPPVIIVDRRNMESAGHGRVIRGRGYRRGGAPSSGGATPSARPSRSSRPASAAPSGSGTRSRGAATGRKARRRGGG